MRKQLLSALTAVITLSVIAIPGMSLADPPGGHPHGKHAGKHADKHWDKSDKHWDKSDKNDKDHWKKEDDDRWESGYRGNIKSRDNWTFTTSQRTRLLDLLEGRRRYPALLSDRLRYNIWHQEALPPGIAKNVARGKPLPPGIAKKVIPLSSDVNRYLGFPYHKNYRVGVLNNDVILYDIATNLILDILPNILSR